PKLLISIEDNSGVDFFSENFALKLDGLNANPDEYVLSFDPHHPGLARIAYAPPLTQGEHLLTVSVMDVNANSTIQHNRFFIAEHFGIDFVANHPNPFYTETTIAFQISDLATRVQLDIYTVAGRHLRSFEFADITGYQEVEWDGADDAGNPVANGVYYLKFVAVRDDQRIERIEKMAKLE
ncbi:MAG: hypothetical protein EHM72_20050, partial [Calditrichaeota bacterium]